MFSYKPIISHLLKFMHIIYIIVKKNIILSQKVRKKAYCFWLILNFIPSFLSFDKSYKRD